MKILMTGGAGYIGSALTPMLLNLGHEVTIFDNLMYGGAHLLPYFEKRGFEFIRGDIRDKSQMKEALVGQDFIIHLAALVGYPLCKMKPRQAIEINKDATQQLLALKGTCPILYASTGSNYGAVIGEKCTEETPLNPLSLYGQTKTAAEEMVLNDENGMGFRFATAFGISPRMRLDLLVNDFVFQATKIKHLVMYEKNYKRTFIHLADICKAFMMAINNWDKWKAGKVYNVGNDSMNYTKEDIALLIKKEVDYYLVFTDAGTDEDQRNYEVDYSKVQTLGFHTTIDMETGIRALVKACQAIDAIRPMSNV